MLVRASVKRPNEVRYTRALLELLSNRLRMDQLVSKLSRIESDLRCIIVEMPCSANASRKKAVD